jgi:ubiquinone/menaquinone biosynthesis C-methylase UbiE
MPIQKDPEGIETLHLQRHTDITGQRVLEVGCGDGRLTWRYAGIVARVTGIDPDMDALYNALHSCPSSLREVISFVRADSLHLPFSKESFDRTILAWSL